jgi:hypothetical protein
MTLNKAIENKFNVKFEIFEYSRYKEDFYINESMSNEYDNNGNLVEDYTIYTSQAINTLAEYINNFNINDIVILGYDDIRELPIIKSNDIFDHSQIISILKDHSTFIKYTDDMNDYGAYCFKYKDKSFYYLYCYETGEIFAPYYYFDNLPLEGGNKYKIQNIIDNSKLIWKFIDEDNTKEMLCLYYSDDFYVPLAKLSILGDYHFQYTINDFCDLTNFEYEQKRTTYIDVKMKIVEMAIKNMAFSKELINKAYDCLLQEVK